MDFPLFFFFFLFFHIRAQSLSSESATALAQAHGGLVIIGMRGAGKTTFGRRAAECLGFEFADLDAVIERAVGPIPAYVAANGCVSSVLGW